MNYLQCFIDTDYIIPVVDSYDGNLYKYSSDGDARQWLFFYNTPHKSGLDYGRSFKALYESGSPGYIGDFWEKVENDETYDNGIAKVSACDLLEHSGILPTLRKFYHECTGTITGNVPTILVFSESISLPARKKLLSYLSTVGFDIRSYSSTLESLAILKIINERYSLKPVFGDKVLFFQSSGKQLYLSYSVFDGTSFLPTSQRKKIEYEGDSFVQRKLVEYIVNKVDENNSFLSPESKQKECAFQMKHAEEWYNRLLKEGSFTITNFYYSSDFDQMSPYACKIESGFIHAVLENAMRTLLIQIQRYKEEVIKNDLLIALFTGDLFKDFILFDKMINIVGGSDKACFLRDNDVQESLHAYHPYAEGIKEEIPQFDSIYRNMKLAVEAISIWIESAEKIRLLQVDIQTLSKTCSDELRILTPEMEHIQGEWKKEMGKSRFDEAEKILTSPLNGEQNLNILMAKGIELLRQKESYATIFQETKQFEGAANIIESIERDTEILNNAILSWEKLRGLRKELSDQTRYYRACYPQYIEKLSAFRKESNRQVLERLLTELQQLSLEPLPVINITELKIDIRAEVIKSGGLFKKKKTLKIAIEIEKGRELPCNCILIISPSALSKVQRFNVYTEEIERKTTGTLERSYDLPLSGIGKADKLYVYFWPDEQEKISINSFNENLCYVNL